MHAAISGCAGDGAGVCAGAAAHTAVLHMTDRKDRFQGEIADDDDESTSPSSVR